MSKKETNILQDISQYCAKSERCSQDVVKKLKAWEVGAEEIAILLEKLKRENFLNDGRYANAYVHDKWKFEHWGKNKIRHKLFLKNIPLQQIQISLETIDQEEYVTNLADQLSKKERELENADRSKTAKRLYNFAVSRGFEEELIMQWMQKRNKE
jgi:regulatory protein